MLARFRRTVVMLFCLVVFGAGVLAWYVYLHYTDPETLQRLTLGAIRKTLPGAEVTLDRVEGHPLSSVVLRDLVVKLPDDDGKQQDFLDFSALYVRIRRDLLLDGEFRVRRIVIEKPTLRLRELDDGSWNVTPWLSDKPIIFPTEMAVDVRDARISVEFSSHAIKPIELTGVDLHLDCKPPSDIVWSAQCLIDSIFPLQLSGTADGAKKSAKGTIASDGPLDLAGLRKAQPALIEALLSRPETLSGKIELQAKFSAAKHVGGPDNGPGGSLALAGKLTEGAIDDPRLPYPISGASASFRVDATGARVTDFECKMGPMTAKLTGSVPNWDTSNWQAEVRVEHLPISHEIYRMLPESKQKLLDEYNPTGSVSVVGKILPEGGTHVFHGSVSGRNLTMTYDRLPFTATNVDGRATFNTDGTVSLDARGLTGKAPVELHGSLSDVKPGAAIDVTISGTDLPLDERLRRALPPNVQAIAERFHGTAHADYQARITRPKGAEKATFQIEADVEDPRCLCDWFPYPLDDVSGHLSISPERTVFRQFVGRSGEASVRIDGQTIKTTDGVHVEVHVKGYQVPFDAKLKRALPLDWHAAWDQVQPEGTANLQYDFAKPPGEEARVEFELDPVKAAVTPASFPYRFEDLSGVVRYADHTVRWEKMTARHGDAPWSCTAGQINILPDGGRLLLDGVICPALVFDDDLRQALPVDDRVVFDFLKPDKPGSLKIKHESIRWYDNPNQPLESSVDMSLGFERANLIPSVGLTNVTGTATIVGSSIGDDHQVQGNIYLQEVTETGFRATDVSCRVEGKGDEIWVENIKGNLYSGQLHGRVWASCGDVPAYKCRLDVFGASFGQYVRETWPNGPAVDGLVNASLVFQGEGATIHQLNGDGTINMHNADIYRLPLLFDLFDFLSLQMPDGQAFETASATFKFRDRLLLVDKFELISPSVSLFLVEKQGRMNLETSDIDMRLGARWARGRLRIPVFTETLNTASDQLLTVRVTGQLSDPVFTPEPGSVLRQILTTPASLLRPVIGPQ
ncbi:hypothetical protein Pan216_01460 [Planctomycetes bacterium Pan216]|uniref:Uncharacterized protein n=1 Tax=Kolteria novifilia TaxID=2527975 RepID=A0A518AX67_9BACT|nr:hypothetical protein Pan216_01460 [Planctomycetes bacterium Pan216]